ncbi:serine/threonine-protein kinase [Streptomyces sp. NBC_00448]|uniref:serine/threonine-protein kinase n=1 Tax=Streptomyces sp. NBC_00448 TaxID=2903652 RepID=UPI002E2017FD
MDELRADDPRWIGAYRLLGRLGSGGMGQVFLARSQRGRTVAVKVVRAHLAEQEEFRTRFRREVRAARKVGGRWTAPVLDAETEADVPWVATGYVPGPSLQQVVAKEYGPLPEQSVRVLAAGLTHALADIHGAGLVHRDLKPSNVMITIDGPRVIDFGIARALETVADASLTTTGAMVGSPAFMSPEQVRGDRVTPACDIFCLGSVLAYAATGLQPFGAASSGVHAQMFRIVQEPPDLDAVPEGLRALVAACLAKEPDARPSLADVRQLLGEDGTKDADPDGEPWLPGAIVARLGRHAVRLLELEAEVEAPLEAPAESAETMVLTPAKARPAERPEEPPAGPTASDPREPVVAQPVPAQPVTTQPIVTLPVIAQPAATQEEVVAQAAASPYAPPSMTDAHGPMPGPVAPSGAPKALSGLPVPPGPAEPEPAPPRRKRWPLVAAGVALVLVAGGATAYVATRDGTDDKAGPGPTSSTKAPSTAPSGTASTDQPTQKPAPIGVGGLREMVGTWRTSFTSADNGDNTRTLTVHENGDVELSGDSASYSCFWDMKVTTSGPPVELSASKVVSGTPASSCAPGDASVLSLVDSTHLQRSDLDDGKAPLTYTKVDG